ncbi:MAG: hypothetical protein SFX73_39465 [Kofleriaceae bacterium]|nr:hypothetical protein [Kofleriaceae bacterium]
MRKLPAAVAISAAVHVALVGIVSTVELEREERPQPAPHVEVIDVTLPPPPYSDEPPAMEVAVLPPETTARIPELPPPSPTTPAHEPTRENAKAHKREAIATVAPGRALVETNGTTTTSGEPTTTTTTEPGKPSMFDMRRPGNLSRRDLGLGPTNYGDALDHHVPEGMGAKPEVAASGQLQPDGGGTYRSDQGVFTAKIAKDGSVSLKDGKNLRINIPLAKPGKLVRGAGTAVATWYRDNDKPVGFLGRPSGPGPGESRINLKEAIEGQTDLSEARGKGNEIDTAKAPIPIAGGGFDITDAIMRSKGADPYAAKKLAFLDSTRDERVEMGKRYKSEQLAKASRITKENLDRLRATVRDPAARKQALFEMWDEIEETGPDELVVAGQASRKLIIAFIRTHLPAGSEYAYSLTELAAYNAHKQSKARFVPYEQPARDDAPAPR